VNHVLNWVNEAVFYHIYPLGLCGCPKENRGEETAGNRILKIIEWIPHLKEMGVNAVYLGPIWESVCHGYDTNDYRVLDKRLGTNNDLKTVIKAFHNADIKVILDGVFNHIGRGHFAFLDVKENRENSKYVNWISGINFSGNNAYNDGFYYDCWSGAQELVKLNLYNEDVDNYLLESIGMWIDEYDIDGLRLDAADCILKDFFKKLKWYTKQKKADFWLMGEIIHGDYKGWANEEMLDSVTNYECWKGIYSSHNDHNYFEINYALKRQWGIGGIYQNICLYNFVDNHDVNRIISLLTEEGNIYPTYTLLFTMPGVPSIYYGSEWAIPGEKSKEEGDYPLRPQMDIDECEGLNDDLIEHIQTLAEIRKNSKALQYGVYEEIQVRNETLVFARRIESEYVIVALNNTKEKKTLQFDYDNQNYEVTLEPYGSKIWK